jgi:hypothetical protein
MHYSAPDTYVLTLTAEVDAATPAKALETETMPAEGQSEDDPNATPLVKWENAACTVGSASPRPWAGRQNDRAGIKRAYAMLLEALDVTGVTPGAVVVDGEHVAVHGSFRYRALATEITSNQGSPHE